MRPLAGAAIAASVALMAIVSVSTGVTTGSGENAQPAGIQSAATGTSVALTKAAPFVSPNILPQGPASQPVSLSGGLGGANRRMNAYLLRHYQVAGSSGRGFVSFVPIVINRSNDEAAVSETRPARYEESEKTHAGRQ